MRKHKAKAVFLDRDGTINREVDHLYDLRQLRILPGVAKAVREINRLGFLVIIITNQSVIGHGLATEEKIDKIHGVLAWRLGRRGGKLDAIYYCLHHPEAKLERYRVRCHCRKPRPGMIIKAAKKLGINLKKSFMVGDTTGDILVGKRAGLITILVKTGYGGRDGKHNARPDFVVKNLSSAVAIIKRLNPKP